MLDTLTELKGQRVLVKTFSGDTPTGVLRGVTDATIWLGETSIPRSEIWSISPAPLYCSSCHGETFLLHDGMCASCYRKAAYAAPTPQEPCEIADCDRGGVRNPGTDIFMCPQHHAEKGHHLILHGSAMHDLVASCYTDDVTSDRHEWGQVRGARFRCIRCRRAEKWDPELLHSLRGDSDD